MTARHRSVPLADGRVRHHTILMDDENDDKNIRRAFFLQTLVDGQGILEAGGKRFDELHIKHDGRRWMAEVIATVAAVRE